MKVISSERRDVALGGLRGCAVLLVIAQHLGWLSFGWAGVQLFFVLSGFLITRVLLQDIAHASLPAYLKNFYLRRALRILPALYLYLTVMIVIAWLLQDWGPLRERLPPAALFYLNFSVLGQGAEFNFSSWHGFATNHLWSLAVEEHFYLLWPLVVYCAGRRYLKIVVLAAFALGPLLRWICADYWADLGSAKLLAQATYLMSTSHVDAFAAGALVALLPPAVLMVLSRRSALVFGGMGLAVLLAVGHNIAAGVGLSRSFSSLGFPPLMTHGEQYLWGYSLLNLMFAMTLALSLTPGRFATLLSSDALTFTGRISYGLYLVHFPMLAFFFWLGGELLPTGLRGWEFITLISVPYLAACFCVASLSFHYYELPWLRLKGRWTRERREKGPGQFAVGLSTTA